MGTTKIITMFKRSYFLIFLPLILLLGKEVKTKEAKSRDPRLFYVSTTTSTTTVLTATICFMTTNAALTTACGKRKRRRFATEDLVPFDGEIDPARISDLEEVPDYDELVSNSKDLSEESKREGRVKFLVYWLTTTSLSTFLSYTNTWTIGSLVCTPSGYGMSEC